ncbi:MAG: leucine-rich repeat domain-containing protein [Verrucomicrobiales bacterium]
MRISGFDTLELPSDLGKLETLELRGNQNLLERLQQSRELTSLRSLTVHTQTGLPAALGEGMPQLEYLDLSECDLRGLELHNDLKNLRVLRVSGNPLLESLAIPPGVTELDIQNTKIDIAGLDGGTAVRTLILSGYQTSSASVPAPLLGVEDLSIIALPQNSDPKFLSSFAGLTRLGIGFTGPGTFPLPDGLARLESLSITNFSGEPGTLTLPYDLANLRSLDVFGIAVNTEAFEHLPSLEALRLHSNAPVELVLPPSMVELESLELSGPITSFKLGTLPELSSLSLVGSSLTSLEIPRRLSRFTTLEIRSNQSLASVTLPDDLSSLVALHVDSNSSLQAFSLPEGLSQLSLFEYYGTSSLNPEMPTLAALNLPDSLPKVTRLRIFNSELMKLPQNMERLEHLELIWTTLSELDLSGSPRLAYLTALGNKLSKVLLPEQASRLYAVDLSANELPTLEIPPTALNLIYINLDFNLLGSFNLPPGLGRLRSINASRNGLSSFRLPTGFSRLTQLSLYENRLSSIEFAEPAPLLQTAYLHSNRLESVRFLDDHSQLHTLSLSGNRLEDWTLPFGLTSLNWLDFSDNETSRFTVSDESNLRVLYANGNQLRDTSFLSKMLKLNSLFLDFNNLETLEIPLTLEELQYLWLNQNRLSDLAFLAKVPSLTTLNLATNNVSDIKVPPGSGDRLADLDLRDNPLNDLDFVKDLPGLRRLQILNTGLETIVISPQLSRVSLSIGEPKSQTVVMPVWFYESWKSNPYVISAAFPENAQPTYKVYSPDLALEITSATESSIEFSTSGIDWATDLESSTDLQSWQKEGRLAKGSQSTSLSRPGNQRHYRLRNVDTTVIPTPQRD